MSVFAGVEWDAGNLAKCQKHGVSIDEIEQVFGGTPRYAPDLLHSTAAEQRFVAVGRNRTGRPVFVVFTLRDKEGRPWVRPISARYMHAKEAARYGHAEDPRNADR